MPLAIHKLENLLLGLRIKGGPRARERGCDQ
jgi:hypothetical protein